MTELSLFSNQAPPAHETDGGDATGVSRGGEPAPELLPAQPKTPASPAASPASGRGRGGPSPRRPSGQQDASASPAASPAVGESGRGGPSSEHLLGLLDGLVLGLGALGGGRLEECLRLVGRCEARLAAVKADKVAELARWRGEDHAAAVLRGDLKQSRGAANREVAFAGRLGDLPGTAEALANGAITPQHARAIADASAHTAIDEAELLNAAETEPADTFGRTVRDHVNEKSAGEDLEKRRRRQRARREATIKQESDGMYTLFGTFDPLAGARVQTALAAMAKALWHNEDPNNRATPAQRYADALEALITRHNTRNSDGDESGTGDAQRATLLVIADYDTVAGQLADARLVDGTPLAPSELLQIALQADILPALFATKSQPLWLGHKYRTASVAQRIALAVRDKGCAACGAANSFCQAHHENYWEHGGPTDIDNLCLLCSDCHKQVHEHGALLTRGPDGECSLKHPPNGPPATKSHNGAARNNNARHKNGSPANHTGNAHADKARTGKARTGNTHAGRHGPSGRQDGATAATNQPLRC